MIWAFEKFNFVQLTHPGQTFTRCTMELCASRVWKQILPDKISCDGSHNVFCVETSITSCYCSDGPHMLYVCLLYWDVDRSNSYVLVEWGKSSSGGTAKLHYYFECHRRLCMCCMMSHVCLFCLIIYDFLHDCKLCKRRERIEMHCTRRNSTSEASRKCVN